VGDSKSEDEEKCGSMKLLARARRKTGGGEKGGGL
jgi:hypothetical protein